MDISAGFSPKSRAPVTTLLLRFSKVSIPPVRDLHSDLSLLQRGMRPSSLRRTSSELSEDASALPLTFMVSLLLGRDFSGLVILDRPFALDSVLTLPILVVQTMISQSILGIRYVLYSRVSLRFFFSHAGAQDH